MGMPFEKYNIIHSKYQVPVVPLILQPSLSLFQFEMSAFENKVAS